MCWGQLQARYKGNASSIVHEDISLSSLSGVAASVGFLVGSSFPLAIVLALLWCVEDRVKRSSLKSAKRSAYAVWLIWIILLIIPK